MPEPEKTEHRTFTNVALPYQSNSSPIDTDPSFVAGQNVLTSLRNFLERFPGFAAQIETTATKFTKLKRIFVWRRWDDPASGATRGAYIVMFSDGAKVYKLQLGTDPQAVLIWTDGTSGTGEYFDYVEANNQCYFGNGTAGNMKRFDGTTVYNWGIVAPSVSPSLALGGTGISAAVSYCYLVTYGYGTGTGSTAIAVGESSPGPVSACSGVFSNKTVSLGLTASTDPQVNQIHLYRTTDGGSTDPSEMREVANSPYPNVTATVTDVTLDANLSIETAPPSLRNDPPPPMKGMVFYETAGRIYGFSGNTVYYSGQEEIGRGVPWECFPGGLDGNFYPWAKQVMALAPLPDGVAVFMNDPIGKIEGDSLDNFRRYTLLLSRGTRSRTAVASLGGSVVWLDTSNQVWLSDQGEIGADIRPDLVDLDPSQTYITIHISGIFHWVCVLDAKNGKLFTYDLDRKMWIPPRILNASCLASYETSVGTVDLIAGLRGAKAMKMVKGSYLDDGAPYAAFVNTNQFDISPAQNKAWKGVIDWVEWKRNAVPMGSVFQMTDDNPISGTFVDLTRNIGPSPNITQGKAILTERATSNSPTAQLATIRFEWPAANTGFEIYEIDLASHPI